jgi:hypothetical protein
MVMWRIKSCPRCGGDMFIGKEDKWFQQCIQCSHRAELKILEDFQKQPKRKPVHATTKG